MEITSVYRVRKYLNHYQSQKPAERSEYDKNHQVIKLIA